jgi:hypothetical protein
MNIGRKTRTRLAEYAMRKVLNCFFVYFDFIFSFAFKVMENHEEIFKKRLRKKNHMFPLNTKGTYMSASG